MSTTIGRTQTELTNARARIVGEREGMLADAIVWIVRTASSFGRAVAGVAARVGGVITPLGWSVALFAVLALAAGYGFGWTEAVVAGWTAVALLLIATLYLAGRIGFDVGLSLPTNRVVVGDRAPGEVTVRNPGRRRLAGARVEVPVGAGLASFASPSLAGGEEHSDDDPPAKAKSMEELLARADSATNVSGAALDFEKRLGYWRSRWAAGEKPPVHNFGDRVAEIAELTLAEAGVPMSRIARVAHVGFDWDPLHAMFLEPLNIDAAHGTWESSSRIGRTIQSLSMPPWRV